MPKKLINCISHFSSKKKTGAGSTFLNVNICCSLFKSLQVLDRWLDKRSILKTSLWAQGISNEYFAHNFEVLTIKRLIVKIIYRLTNSKKKNHYSPIKDSCLLTKAPPSPCCYPIKSSKNNFVLKFSHRHTLIVLETDVRTHLIPWSLPFIFKVDHHLKSSHHPPYD